MWSSWALVLVTRRRSGVQRLPPGTSMNPMDSPSGTPSRASSRTSSPMAVLLTFQAPQAASSRSSSSTVTPMGSCWLSLGCVAVNGTRAGSVSARAPRSNCSRTMRRRSSTRGSVFQGVMRPETRRWAVLELAGFVARQEAGFNADAVGFVAVAQGGAYEPAGVELGPLGRRQELGRDGPLNPVQPRAQAERQEVRPPHLRRRVRLMPGGFAGQHFRRHTVNPGDGGHVELLGLDELGFVGGDHDGLELGAPAEHGNLAAALMGALPAGFQVVRFGLADALVGRQDAAGDGAVAEELG